MAKIVLGFGCVGEQFDPNAEFINAVDTFVSVADLVVFGERMAGGEFEGMKTLWLVSFSAFVVFVACC
jgi:hypothetical protein